MSWRQTAGFYRQLAVMTRTGMPIGNALRLAGETAGGSYRARGLQWSVGCTGGANLASQMTAAGEPVLACALPFGPVSASPVSRHVLLAYDDVFSIEYFYRKVRPYWRRDGWGITELLQAAEVEYTDLTARCAAFDAEITADLRQAGGEKFAALCALAFRQCIAPRSFAEWGWQGHWRQR